MDDLIIVFSCLNLLVIGNYHIWISMGDLLNDWLSFVYIFC